jgi:hypothetical protein
LSDLPTLNTNFCASITPLNNDFMALSIRNDSAAFAAARFAARFASSAAFDAARFASSAAARFASSAAFAAARFASSAAFTARLNRRFTLFFNPSC